MNYNSLAREKQIKNFMNNEQLETSNNTYHDYLTEIERGKSNPVINFAVETITTRFTGYNPPVKILDVGSYNGAMLNGIYTRLPESLRQQVQLYGFDLDNNMLSEGKQKYPHIIFKHYDITQSPNLSQKYDLTILSNILHEVYSAHIGNHKTGTKAVQKALRNVTEMVGDNGYLILMDGIKPTNGRRLLKIDISNNGIKENLLEFAQSTYISPISCFLTNLGLIEITLEDLATFLSKAKYIHRGFWDLESRQVYHYFTEEEFRMQMASVGLEIVDFLPQYFDNTVGIEIVEPLGTELPAKNTLVFAQKV